MIYLEARRTSPDEGALIWFRCEGGRQGTCHDGSVEHQNIIDANVAIADWADSRTPQQIYDEEVLAPLDFQVLKDAARMVEDFYDALVDQLPQSMKDKHEPLMAERKAKRAARP